MRTIFQSSFEHKILTEVDKKDLVNNHYKTIYEPVKIHSSSYRVCNNSFKGYCGDKSVIGNSIKISSHIQQSFALGLIDGNGNAFELSISSES